MAAQRPPPAVESWREAILEEGFRMRVMPRPGDILEPLLLCDDEQVRAVLSLRDHRCFQHQAEFTKILSLICSRQQEQPESRPRDAPPAPSFRRLISVARGEVFWIACGLFALLCRMPFTLAVPHYVSVAISGALSGNSEEAKVREVVDSFVRNSGVSSQSRPSSLRRVLPP